MTLLEMLRRLIRPGPPSLMRPDGSYVLPCAACGEDAVTFQLQEGRVQANSISNVYRITRWSGKAAQRLAELLVQANAAAVLDYLASLGQHGCPAYCPECGCIYCRKHSSVEEEWSGSWYTAGYATCPKGHKREFE
jgi:hypothetical protein